MNRNTKRQAESVVRNTEDSEAASIINELLDEIENLEYLLEKSEEEVSNLQSDIDKWRNEVRDWEDKYYEAQQG
jgi:phage shock protein A